MTENDQKLKFPMRILNGPSRMQRLAKSFSSEKHGKKFLRNYYALLRSEDCFIIDLQEKKREYKIPSI